MKNVILGMIGMLIALYTAVIALGIYGIYARKDELDNSLAEVMESVMQQHYRSAGLAEFTGEERDAAAVNAAVESEIREELALRLASDSRIEVHIVACDMEQGILAVLVSESFRQINGKERVIGAEKVLIADS